MPEIEEVAVVDGAVTWMIFLVYAEFGVAVSDMRKKWLS